MAEDRCALDVVFIQNQDKHFFTFTQISEDCKYHKALLANAHPNHLKHRPLKNNLKMQSETFHLASYQVIKVN